MDRLARNLDDLPALVQGLTSKGVRVGFVKEGLVFPVEDSPMANLMLSVMGPSPNSNGARHGATPQITQKRSPLVCVAPHVPAWLNQSKFLVESARKLGYSHRCGIAETAFNAADFGLLDAGDSRKVLLGKVFRFS